MARPDRRKGHEPNEDGHGVGSRPGALNAEPDEDRGVGPGQESGEISPGTTERMGSEQKLKIDTDVPQNEESPAGEGEEQVALVDSPVDEMGE
jgi:hypothetical protein